MKKIIIYVFLLGLIINCTPSYKEEIAKLDNVDRILKEAEETFQDIDTIKIETSYKKYAESMEKIENPKFVQDISKEDLDEFKLLNGSFFKNFKEQYKNLKRELDRTKTQTSNLRSDLTEGRMPKPTFEVYMKIEQTASERINDAITIFKKQTENYINTFERIDNKINK